jgi:hypothetical protein
MSKVNGNFFAGSDNKPVGTDRALAFSRLVAKASHIDGGSAHVVSRVGKLLLWRKQPLGFAFNVGSILGPYHAALHKFPFRPHRLERRCLSLSSTASLQLLG